MFIINLLYILKKLLFLTYLKCSKVRINKNLINILFDVWITDKKDKDIKSYLFVVYIYDGYSWCMIILTEH